MDWGQVTYAELGRSLQRAEWRQPRPWVEAFQRLSLPKNDSKLQLRLKCNVYYFRANYLSMVLTAVGLVLLRRPLALLSFCSAVLGAFCASDSVAAACNLQLLRVAKTVHPPLAYKLKAATAGQGLGAPGAPPKPSDVRIVGIPKLVVAAVFVLAGLAGVWAAGVALRIVMAVLVGACLAVSHACLRQPNLKASMASAGKEEFAATWRGQQAAAGFRDFAL